MDHRDEEKPDFEQFEFTDPKTSADDQAGGLDEPVAFGEPESPESPDFAEAAAEGPSADIGETLPEDALSGRIPSDEDAAEGAPSDEAQPEAAEGGAFDLAGLSFGEPSGETEAGEESEEEEKAAKEPKPSLMAKLSKVAEASPYTVMLGISLAVLVIAVLCLVLELRDYDYDVRARSFRQGASLPAVQSVLPNTTATA